VKFGHVVLRYGRLPDKQTGRHTDTLIAILRIPTVDEEIISRVLLSKRTNVHTKELRLTNSLMKQTNSCAVINLT